MSMKIFEVVEHETYLTLFLTFIDYPDDFSWLVHPREDRRYMLLKKMPLKTRTSILLCLLTLTVSATSNDTASEPSEKEASTELTYTVPYYQITPFRAGVLVLGLGAVIMAVLYLPALLYKICYLVGGCQAKENRIRRDHFLAAQLGAARDIRFRNKRSVLEEPILFNLAKAHQKYT